MQQVVVEGTTIFATLYPALFFHELGHLIALKKFNEKILQFKVGSPTVVRFDKISIGLFPLHGHVYATWNRNNSHRQNMVMSA